MTDRIDHLEFLVEGFSMKLTVDALMPRIAPGMTFGSHDLGSKSQFMRKVAGRLKGYAYVSAYAAAKHAAVGLVRSLALELAGSNVSCLPSKQRRRNQFSSSVPCVVCP